VTTTNEAGRRMLLVHAHPDDETINNGATMARYAHGGAAVTLVTCTRGEQGEVIPPRLAHLEAAKAGSGDRLGDHRVGELAAAMAALGVADHRFLGDDAVPGRTAAAARAAGGAVYRDSGMAYDRDGGVVPAPDPPEGAFALADTEPAAERLAAVVRAVRPQVVVGYEPGGGYGHPDHVQAHLVTMRAVELAALAGPDGEPAWPVAKVYWSVMPETLVRAALGLMAAAGGADHHALEAGGRLPSMVVPDDQVTTAVDATAFTDAKRAAMRAHETQLTLSADGAFFGFSNGLHQPVTGLEFYQLVRGTPGGPVDDLGRETDLFGGCAE
jgi:N-acetyl-1-D-myo-inositol-2-amino-2-deoxy-alpha-D-glucopyranoside deacetylase